MPPDRPTSTSTTHPHVNLHVCNNLHHLESDQHLERTNLIGDAAATIDMMRITFTTHREGACGSMHEASEHPLHSHQTLCQCDNMEKPQTKRRRTSVSTSSGLQAGQSNPRITDPFNGAVYSARPLEKPAHRSDDERPAKFREPGE